MRSETINTRQIITLGLALGMLGGTSLLAANKRFKPRTASDTPLHTTWGTYRQRLRAANQAGYRSRDGEVAQLQAMLRDQQPAGGAGCEELQREREELAAKNVQLNLEVARLLELLRSSPRPAVTPAPTVASLEAPQGASSDLFGLPESPDSPNYASLRRVETPAPATSAPAPVAATPAPVVVAAAPAPTARRDLPARIGDVVENGVRSTGRNLAAQGSAVGGVVRSQVENIAGTAGAVNRAGGHLVTGAAQAVQGLGEERSLTGHVVHTAGAVAGSQIRAGGELVTQVGRNIHNTNQAIVSGTVRVGSALIQGYRGGFNALFGD